MLNRAMYATSDSSPQRFEAPPGCLAFLDFLWLAGLCTLSAYPSYTNTPASCSQSFTLGSCFVTTCSSFRRSRMDPFCHYAVFRSTFGYLQDEHSRLKMKQHYVRVWRC